MKKVHVRLLHTTSAKPQDIQATLRGIKALERFGVLVDDCRITSNKRDDKQSLRGVMLGGYIKEVITGREPQVVDFMAEGHRLRDVFAWHSRDTLGFGLMTGRLSIARHGKVEEVTGSGRFLDIALLSLFNFDDIKDPALRLRAIEVAAKYEAGHLFRKGHCDQPSCVMQPKPVRLQVALESIVLRPDLCRTCETEIGRNVSMREYNLAHVSI